MAPTITQVMEGIQTRLATIADLSTSEITPDQVTPPCAFVGVPPVESYHAAMNSSRMMLDFPVTVLVSAALDRTGQLALAAYANPTGATSIKAAIEGDKTLGGIVDDCIVMSFRPLGVEEVGLIGYYGGAFTVRAISTT